MGKLIPFYPSPLPGEQREIQDELVRRRRVIFCTRNHRAVFAAPDLIAPQQLSLRFLDCRDGDFRSQTLENTESQFEKFIGSDCTKALFASVSGIASALLPIVAITEAIGEAAWKIVRSHATDHPRYDNVVSISDLYSALFRLLSSGDEVSILMLDSDDTTTNHLLRLIGAAERQQESGLENVTLLVGVSQLSDPRDLFNVARLSSFAPVAGMLQESGIATWWSPSLLDYARVKSWIGSKLYEFDTDAVTGADIKAKASIPTDYSLYRQSHGSNEPIADSETVSLHNGDHFFSRPPSNVS